MIPRAASHCHYKRQLLSSSWYYLCGNHSKFQKSNCVTDSMISLVVKSVSVNWANMTFPTADPFLSGSLTSLRNCSSVEGRNHGSGTTLVGLKGTQSCYLIITALSVFDHSRLVTSRLVRRRWVTAQEYHNIISFSVSLIAPFSWLIKRFFNWTPQNWLFK